MAAASILSATAPWPLIAVGVAVVVALCLWSLFRRGSLSDRSRSDDC